MRKARFQTVPEGCPAAKIPAAEMAPAADSSSIIKNSDSDASYFRSLEKAGIFLNEPQIKAVRHFKGPLLTLAGAGSGKTSVLTVRAGYLINIKKVDPGEILLVTFTKKAADEMKERIARLPGITKQSAYKIQTATFHAFFLRLLKSRGYEESILSSERHKQIIIKKLLRKHGIADSYQPETLLAELSAYKMNIIEPEEIPARSTAEKEMKKVFKEYEELKKKNKQMDFDDILMEAYKLLKHNQTLLAALQKRFQYIMVDEFQDTNKLQYELMKMLAQSHQNLFVVGDDDQTIYSFNGARNEFILNFHNEFTEAESVTLNINYRSTASILGLGNEIVKHNKHRKTKTLKSVKESNRRPQYLRPGTPDEEADWIFQDIKEKISTGSYTYRDFAILHRAGSNSRAIFEQLTLKGMPFVNHAAGNRTFYEEWPVKEVVSYLRLALNARDFEAMEDVLPTLYIGRDTGMKHINGEEYLQPKKYPLVHLTSLPNIKPFQSEQVRERIKFIRELKRQEPLIAVKRIRNDFYDKYLEAQGKESETVHQETIKEGLDELEASAKRFSSVYDFIQFIDEMIEKNIEMRELKKDHEADAVSLMTIHRSKGLEFPVVYLIGASEGIIPHSTALDADKMADKPGKDETGEKLLKAVEEERRLAYVAVTRAMEELYISSPAYFRGKKAEVSRFLTEAYGLQQKPGEGPVRERKNIERDLRFKKKEKPKEKVVAWICTGDNCNAWQRADSYQEQVLKEKHCPLCNSAMGRGHKVV
jgi:DNA helicase-2/ATP-dependent DNA helicase PcrA